MLFLYFIPVSVASLSAADDNNMEEARKYGKAAMWVNVAGIILTIIGIVIGIIIYVAYVNATQDAWLYDDNAWLKATPDYN